MDPMASRPIGNPLNNVMYMCVSEMSDMYIVYFKCTIIPRLLDDRYDIKMAKKQPVEIHLGHRPSMVIFILYYTLWNYYEMNYSCCLKWEWHFGVTFIALNSNSVMTTSIIMATFVI